MIDEEIEALTNAHRALAARHEALFQVCKVMFAMINADCALKERLLTTVYDATSDHMDTANFDADYQERVRAAIDELGAVILAGGR